MLLSELTICIFYISVRSLMLFTVWHLHKTQQHLCESAQNLTAEVAFILPLHSKRHILIHVRNHNSVCLNAGLTVQRWLQFFYLLVCLGYDATSVKQASSKNWRAAWSKTRSLRRGEGMQVFRCRLSVAVSFLMIDPVLWISAPCMSETPF